MVDYTKYQVVEYIQASASQYITLNDTLDWDQDKIVLVCCWDSAGVNEMMLSFGGTTAKSGWLYSYDTTHSVRLYYFIDSGSQSYVEFCWQKDSLIPHTFELDFQNKTGKLDGVAIGTMSSSVSASSPEKITLFCGSGSYAGGFLTHGKIYSYKHYRNGDLYSSLVPVKRGSDNVVGLYDEQKDIFWPSASSTQFMGGGGLL